MTVNPRKMKGWKNGFIMCGVQIRNNQLEILENDKKLKARTQLRITGVDFCHKSQNTIDMQKQPNI